MKTQPPPPMKEGVTVYVGIGCVKVTWQVNGCVVELVINQVCGRLSEGIVGKLGESLSQMITRAHPQTLLSTN